MIKRLVIFLLCTNLCCFSMFVFSQSSVQPDTLAPSDRTNKITSTPQPDSLISPLSIELATDFDRDKPLALFRFWGKDGEKQPTLLLRPYFENGSYLIINDSLKSKYNTHSVYYFGFGLQYGHPQTHTCIPFAQIAFSKYQTDRVMYENTVSDSTLSFKQITIGILAPLFKQGGSYINLKIGYTINIVKESFYHIDDVAAGFVTGISLERKCVGNTRVYGGFSYLYQKSKHAECKNFDMMKISFGFVL